MRGILMHRPLRSGLSLLLLATLSATGCYRAVPIEGAPQPGTRVSAVLTPAGRSALESVIGPDVERVEGEAANVTEDRWDLYMLTSWHVSGREQPWQRQAVTFSPAHFAKVERRELNRTKTWLTVAAVSAGAVLLGRGFVRAVSGGSEERGGEQPGQ